MSGSSQARAWTTIAVMAAMAVVVQPLSVPPIDYGLGRLYAGADPHSQWRAYYDGPPARILFIGGSRARQDVDGGAIAAALDLPRRAVAKIGVDGASPELIQALAQRVASHRPVPPTVVVEVTEYVVSTNYQPDLSTEYWELSDPPDAAYLRTALQLDTNRGSLVAQWLLPAFVNYRFAALGLRCDSPIPVPPEHPPQVADDLGASNACQYQARWPSAVMSPAVERETLALYREALAGFQWSSGHRQALITTVETLRAAGARVAFAMMPTRGIADVAPDAYRAFQEGMESLAASLGVALWDLHDQMPADPVFWSDPSHLNNHGAAELAPRLAALSAAIS